tara:strand:+ start:829 stop:1077 length:249 start_codon:yes stop_codon:yes gene_type:complete
MPIQVINIGTSPDDGTGDLLRDAMDKINQNFALQDGQFTSFIVPNMTTITRDALTPALGMIIYNTTDSKFQGYENAVWTNLI